VHATHVENTLILSGRLTFSHRFFSCALIISSVRCTTIAFLVVISILLKKKERVSPSSSTFVVLFRFARAKHGPRQLGPRQPEDHLENPSVRSTNNNRTTLINQPLITSLDLRRRPALRCDACHHTSVPGTTHFRSPPPSPVLPPQWYACLIPSSSDPCEGIEESSAIRRVDELVTSFLTRQNRHQLGVGRVPSLRWRLVAQPEVDRHLRRHQEIAAPYCGLQALC
jgi:hypothetical protein